MLWQGIVDKNWINIEATKKQWGLRVVGTRRGSKRGGGNRSHICGHLWWRRGCHFCGCVSTRLTMFCEGWRRRKRVDNCRALDGSLCLEMKRTTIICGVDNSRQITYTGAWCLLHPNLLDVTRYLSSNYGYDVVHLFRAFRYSENSRKELKTKRACCGQSWYEELTWSTVERGALGASVQQYSNDVAGDLDSIFRDFWQMCSYVFTFSTATSTRIKGIFVARTGMGAKLCLLAWNVYDLMPVSIVGNRGTCTSKSRHNKRIP